MTGYLTQLEARSLSLGDNVRPRVAAEDRLAFSQDQHQVVVRPARLDPQPRRHQGRKLATPPREKALNEGKDGADQLIECHVTGAAESRLLLELLDSSIKKGWAPNWEPLWRL